MTEKFNQDGSISQQWLAEEITSKEGKLREVDIAQVKEILKIFLDMLHELQIEDAAKFDELLAKHE